MKPLAAISLILFLTLSLFLGCGGKDKSQFVKITEKELASNSFNKAVIKGKLKNSGSSEIGKVVLKAQILDDKGSILAEPFEMFGPIKAGEEIEFSLKTDVDYYKAKDFKVEIDSVQ